jgi:hypothetical protein
MRLKSYFCLRIIPIYKRSFLMNFTKRSLAALCIFSIFAGSLYAKEKKGLTIIPRKLKIINNYTQPITVQIHAKSGRLDTLTVPAKTTKVYKWHWGFKNITSFRVTYAPGAGFEKGRKNG